MDGAHSAGGLGLSRPWRYGSRWRGWLECAGILAAYGLYEFVRSTLGRKGAGDRNGLTIIHWERRLHINWERHFQQFAVDHKRFTQFLDLYYGTIHFIIPPLVLWVLWKWRPSTYSVWRNRVCIATLIALLGFWLWPLTPPRLMPAHFGFIDTDALYGGQGVLNQGAAKDTNLYAAMPSLHVGWALWCAAAIAPLLKRRWMRIAVWLYPAFTFATVTATGNHYWLDGLAGAAVDVIGYWLGTWLTRTLSLRPRRGKDATIILTGKHDDSTGDHYRSSNGDDNNVRARVDVLVKQPNAN